MSSTIGKKIRNIREALKIGRQEFADKTGIPKNTLIGIEVSKHEPGAKALIAIGSNWPEYSEYLLSDGTQTRQINPEITLAERNAGIMNGDYFAPLFAPNIKPEDLNTRKMKKLQKEFDSFNKIISDDYQEAMGTTAKPSGKK